MNSLILLFIGIAGLFLGSILGYFARQSIARKQAGTLEAQLQKKILQTKEEAEKILAEAKERSRQILDNAQKEVDERRNAVLKTERLLLRRENILEQKMLSLEKERQEFEEKVKKLKQIKEELERLREEAIVNLERISQMSKEKAKEELLANLAREYQQEMTEKLKRLEQEGWEKYESKAKELLVTAVQRCALSQAQETTTTTLALPSEEIKGRIIGKEGRNIRTLEKLTGVEIIVDEAPETVIISAFDPVRRQIAKIALEKLIQDGRIQPAKIEEQVAKAEEEINKQIKEAGEAAVYETGVIGLDPKLVQLLGRLKFRTSYGQNALLHSIEVSHLAGALAAELGLNVMVCKKAGLLHDIGKSVDQQVEGSHVDIGVKILEKFGVEKEVIDAVKSHHEDYPFVNLESVIVQVADQISGARPGARKDTLENYLKRLADLEKIALQFPGVEKAWALQAGREIRVFVKPEEIDDWGARNLAKEIARQIQEELKYPGEIKVNVIRELRAIEYAK